MSIHKYAKCGEVTVLFRNARKDLSEALLTISANELINVPDEQLETLKEAERIMKNLQFEFTKRYMM